MIIKGKARAGGGDLAAHLGRTDTNERVSVMEMRGVAGRDLDESLREMEAQGAGVASGRPLYHANIDPDRTAHMTPEQWKRSVDLLEEKLELTGQPRVVVLHVKEARAHAHVVWSRIDTERGRAISDSHNYRAHEEVSRQLEREFNHERVRGVHTERDGKPRPERTPSRAETQQAERTGIDPKQVKREVTELWRQTDNGASFVQALEQAGYRLARGDKRDFVIVDREGGTHSLTRRLEGVKAADARARMADYDAATVARVAEIRARGKEPPAPRQKPDTRAQRDAWKEQRKAERAALWAAYQAERQAWKQSHPNPSREAVRAEYAKIAAEVRMGRKIVRQSTRPGSRDRLTGESLVAFHGLQKRDQLKAQLATQRRENRPPNWRDWTAARAQGGDPAAQAQMRAFAYADSRTPVAQRERIEASARQSSPANEGVTEGVTWRRRWLRGGVEYRIDGKVAAIDKGARVKIVDRKSDRAISLGLALQSEKHRNSIRLGGDKAFRERAADIAAERGLNVTFEDKATRQRFEAQRAAVAEQQRFQQESERAAASVARHVERKRPDEPATNREKPTTRTPERIDRESDEWKAMTPAERREIVSAETARLRQERAERDAARSKTRGHDRDDWSR